MPYLHCLLYPVAGSWVLSRVDVCEEHAVDECGFAHAALTGNHEGELEALLDRLAVNLQQNNQCFSFHKVFHIIVQLPGWASWQTQHIHQAAWVSLVPPWLQMQLNCQSFVSWELESWGCT